MVDIIRQHVLGLESIPVNGATGITTFIRDTLRDGVKFNRPWRAGYGSAKGATDTKGKEIGRSVDLQFRHVIQGKLKLIPSKYTHRRCINIFKALNEKKIKCVSVQHRVGIPKTRLVTELDGIGVQYPGTVVVIELKTTQFTIKQHTARYKVPCKNKRKLTNGLINSEYTSHQLQTAFGMIGLRQQLNPKIKICGIVVVACTDGVKIYDVEREYINKSHFDVATTIRSLIPKSTISTVISKRVATTKSSSSPFTGLPDSPDAKEHVLKRLAQLGFNDIDKRLKRYGSFVARYTNAKTKTTRLAVVGLVHGPTPTFKAGDTKRNKLKEDAYTLWKKRKGKCTVQSYLCYYGSHHPEFIHHVEQIGKTHMSLVGPIKK